MANKSIDERIAEIEAKENKLKQQKKKLKAEQSKQARNARTKRLIEVGAIIEKAIGIEFDTPEKKEQLLSLLTTERSNKYGVTYTYAAYFRDQMMKHKEQ